MVNSKKVPFDSFRSVYKWLVFAGFAPLPDKPKNRLLWVCHEIYRHLAFIIIGLLNMQYIMRIIQIYGNGKDMVKIFDTLTEQIPEANMLIKYLAINLSAKRLNKLRELMDDPIFGARCAKDEEYLEQNRKSMCRLTKGTMILILPVCVAWLAAPILDRFEDDNSEFNKYIPFEIVSWKGLISAVVMQATTLVWTGFGNYAMGILMATHYSQAWVQMRIINYNLKNLISETTPRNMKYIDDSDNSVYDEFVYYIKRHRKVVWYINEVTSIFNFAISFDFCLGMINICIVVFCLGVVDIMSMTFMFYFGLYLLIITQMLYCCYFGGSVQFESNLVLSSAYQSNWVAMSPRFRRILLIAMSSWTVPVVPKVLLGIVPLSLDTFITIIKTSFSLFSVLKASNLGPEQQ